MVIGTGKELVTFAERHGAIISQHIWEALTDLDKCAPKAAVENCHSLQQLKAEIAALIPALLPLATLDNRRLGIDQIIRKMRQLSAV